MTEMRDHDTALTFDGLLGDRSGSLGAALGAGKEFLAGTPTSSLLAAVGRTICSVPPAAGGRYPDKRWFQKSFGRAVTDRPDDLLVGRGLFYLTEQGRLFLDCTAGHYQMTWGYDHPELCALLRDGIERGIVWDNHSNIPAAPVKQLSARLAALANPPRGARAGAGRGSPADCGAKQLRLAPAGSRLDTVHLGLATGSVACAAAIKIMLMHYRLTRGCAATRAAGVRRGPEAPVFVTLQGNYHGTDILAQRLRGMWAEYFANVEVAQVAPNDAEELTQVFKRHGERVAGFWAEPIMMNCEALVLDPSYLQLARALCDQAGALMAFDEIQTGFWFPEVLYTNRLGVEPDFIVLGKGMTAGFHPLSALVYRGDLDCLAQYDAISTNGNAALAAYVGLGCIALIEREAARIAAVGTRLHDRMADLCSEFPDLLQEVRGAGHMTGLKFRTVEDALGFHRSAFERGLWVRVHAYHVGHSTVLTKFALPLDNEIADFAVDTMRALLARRPWK